MGPVSRRDSAPRCAVSRVAVEVWARFWRRRKFCGAAVTGFPFRGSQLTSPGTLTGMW